ncbi:WD repeat-containing protein on Y chromosome-like [Spea bombifrons]|uniref:WD repeat-containing protein on Y chromosome-like n=1 Tax=Spea bombifrons TaxID=233779 RepID=UPI00234A942E|nr:WD repeat-containing protein on Y chromosome-like [Spea bombifrons]
MPLPPLLQKRAHALQRQLLSASLLQELEIFLKRQGTQKAEKRRPSFTNEENILSFDQNESLHLEEKFRLDDLYALEEVFARHSVLAEEVQDAERPQKPPFAKKLKPKKTARREGNLTLREFQNVLSHLFGSEYLDENMELLFNKVDTSCDGFVDWSEFCTYMLLQYKERDYVITRKMTFLGSPVMRLCTRNKQEPTSRMLAISSPPPLWFISVSKGGVLTTWNTALNPQKSYEITFDSKETQSGKRRFKYWTTDAVYLPNVHKIAMATTCRDIHFFDVSTMNMFEEFHLFALNHVPTCFYYWYNVKAPGDRSLLLWGDDSGGVNLLWLLKPNSGVFEKPFTRQPGPHRIYMQELREHSSLLAYQAMLNIHPEAITKLMFIPEQELIVSSSGSSTTSVVIMDIHQKGKVYTWNISKGVRCFDYSKSMNLLVTGGLDHKVRLWNQYVPSRPVAVLSEHTMAVLDVVIYEPLRQIFSYSKDSVLKVWDISSHSCLQTLVLKFPCVQPGRIHEQGNFSFLLASQNPRHLLVSYSDYIGMLRLARADRGEDALVTHDAPLSGVLYNSFFHQVVTASEDSTVVVWDVETGTKSLLLNNVHGSEEITCVAFDRSQRKLITGARNGGLKIWNIQNGHNLHRLQPVDEAEVTCVLPLGDQRLLSVGWNRKIILYDTTNTENMYVTANASWKGGHQHKEDILTADFCPSLGLLVTASFDGEIIVWNTETQRVYVYLRERPRHHPPVDKVLFLQQRSSLKESAILVSSEAGVLRWWGIFTHHKEFGCFYAPGKPDESVFGLACNESSSVLVSGDTSGFIHAWDVSRYALQATDKEERPPLLFSWKAHAGAVVSMDCLLFDSKHFVTSGSSDRTARLWTMDGKCVGTFGQSKNWNLRDPATYQHGTTPDSERWNPTEMGRHGVEGMEGREGEEGMESREGEKGMESRGGEESMESRGGEEGMESRGGEEDMQSRGGEEGMESRGGEEETPAAPSGEGEGRAELGSNVTAVISQESGAGPRRPGILGRSVQEELTKISTTKKDRRRLAPDIDVNKCHRFGQLCSPFQALAMPDMEEFALPGNLPVWRRGVGSGVEGTNSETRERKPS